MGMGDETSGRGVVQSPARRVVEPQDSFAPQLTFLQEMRERRAFNLFPGSRLEYEQTAVRRVAPDAAGKGHDAREPFVGGVGYLQFMHEIAPDRLGGESSRMKAFHEAKVGPEPVRGT